MNGLVDQFIEKLDNFFGRFLFAIERLVCLFISWMQQLFNVFTGMTPARYNNEDEYLVNIFFGNKLVNGVYWGMAAIGIIMAFVFAIIAVTRKGFDLDDKMRQSHGQILRSLFRSIFIILSLSIFMNIGITFTNTLMKSVNNLFNKAPTILDGSSHIEYTEEQFATMSRIFNTVGNYSINPSFNTRYNLNSCYNDIRGDLKYLADTGVFNYHYPKEDNGKTVNTWQTALQELATAADYNKEQPADVYNESIANALNHCMTIIKTDNNFYALKEFDRSSQYSDEDLSLDRILFLCGTMGVGNDAAAKNDAFNQEPDLTDNIRAPYYYGEKSLYDLDQVNKDFYVSFSRMNYLLIYLVGIAIIVNMAIIIVNCIVRIFNLMFLYIIAPPIIAVSPLDDGGKFKQWLTAFIVQAFSVFATVISMRLFLIYIPIVMRPTFQLVSNNVISTIGKLIMIWAGTVAIEKANGLLTGILADNAGWQSIMAGSTAQDVKGSSVGRFASSALNRAEGSVVNAATAPVSFAGNLAKRTAGGVLRAAALPFRPLTGAVTNAAGRFSESFKALEGDLSNSIVESSAHKQSSAEARTRQEDASNRQEERQFRQNLSNYIMGQQGGDRQQPPPPRQETGDVLGQNNNSGLRNAENNTQNNNANLRKNDGNAQNNNTNLRKNDGNVQNNNANLKKTGGNAQNNNRRTGKPLTEGSQKLFGVDRNGVPVSRDNAQGGVQQHNNNDIRNNDNAGNVNNAPANDRNAAEPNNAERQIGANIGGAVNNAQNAQADVQQHNNADLRNAANVRNDNNAQQTNNARQANNVQPNERAGRANNEAVQVQRQQGAANNVNNVQADVQQHNNNDLRRSGNAGNVNDNARADAPQQDIAAPGNIGNVPNNDIARGINDNARADVPQQNIANPGNIGNIPNNDIARAEQPPHNNNDLRNAANVRNDNGVQQPNERGAGAVPGRANNEAAQVQRQPAAERNTAVNNVQAGGQPHNNNDLRSSGNVRNDNPNARAEAPQQNNAGLGSLGNVRNDSANPRAEAPQQNIAAPGSIGGNNTVQNNTNVQQANNSQINRQNNTAEQRNNAGSVQNNNNNRPADNNAQPQPGNIPRQPPPPRRGQNNAGAQVGGKPFNEVHQHLFGIGPNDLPNNQGAVSQDNNAQPERRDPQPPPRRNNDN